jgi:hypothetical protein
MREYQRGPLPRVPGLMPPPFSKAHVQPILSLMFMHSGRILWASALVVMMQSVPNKIANLALPPMIIPNTSRQR